MFIIGRWEVKICTWFTNWGDAHCASETCETSWCTIIRARSGSWVPNTETAKARAGPARNPGTPRPGARRHGKRKNPPNNNMIQSSKTKIYRHPTVSCRDTFQWQVIKSKCQKRECRCETLIRYSHWTENRGYPGWPQACPPLTHLAMLIREKAAQRRCGLSSAKRMNPGHKDSVPIINLTLATRDDPNPAMLAPKSILQCENFLLSYPEWPQACSHHRQSVQQNISYIPAKRGQTCCTRLAFQCKRHRQ